VCWCAAGAGPPPPPPPAGRAQDFVRAARTQLDAAHEGELSLREEDGVPTCPAVEIYGQMVPLRPARTYYLNRKVERLPTGYKLRESLRASLLSESVDRSTESVMGVVSGMTVTPHGTHPRAMTWAARSGAST
jgi:hypothetical protein